MKLSLNWLNDYIDTKNMSAKEIADIFTMSGSCAEKTEKDCPNIRGIVVGKVLSIEKHENAEKLVVCKVLIEKEKTVQIVTGAKNLYVGAFVPVCLDDAVLYDGTIIKSQKLRGVLSQGMMCSLGELGLGKEAFPYAEEDGIFIIKEKCEVGQDIRSALFLNDEVIDFEITSNRPDCLCVFGLAREFSAASSFPLKEIEAVNFEGISEKESSIKINIESDFCKRYMAVLIKDVEIAPSPLWLRNRLRVSGIKPINNIVDITNYVMMEYGIPMHAYDADKIEGMEIYVRTAKNNEKIKTLDHQEYTLTGDELLIRDGKKPISVAGIIGGEDSSVDGKTKNVIFEVGCFNPINIRRTAKKLKIKTEASVRFEKGLNPKQCELTIKRACSLVSKLNIGSISSDIIDSVNYIEKETFVELDCEFINKFLGTDIKKEEIEDILKKLEFNIEEGRIFVPSFRIDIKNKADIAEEVARIYGYDKIPSKLPKSFSKNIGLTEGQEFENELKNYFVSCGLNEIYTFSFISPKLYEKMNIPEEYFKENSAVISNPFGEDTSLMRLLLAPSVVNIMSKNYKNKNEEGYFFEIGKIYKKEGENFKEEEKISIGIYGKNCSFFELKGILQGLFSLLNIENLEYIESKTSYLNPYVCCEIYKDGVCIGEFGALHPNVCENFKLQKNTFIAELSFETLLKLRLKNKKYSPIPKFPAVKRDLSLVCGEDVHCKEIEDEIYSGIGNILEKLEVFDVYKGDQLEANKKSISFSVVFRGKEKTLTDEEVDEKIEYTLKKLESKGIFLRKM